MKNILILGMDGMLGNALVKYLGTKDNVKIFKTTRKKIADRDSSVEFYFDVREDFKEKIIAIIATTKPEIIINCVGFIRPSNTPEDFNKAILINSLLPQILSRICLNDNIQLIHFSTDCIFNGKKGGYVESDIPDETSIYGISKFLGETRQHPNLTIRTSIIGREITSQRNLLDWFLNTKSSKIRGYRNVFWNGVTTITIAKIVERIISKNILFDKSLIQIATNRVSKFELLCYFREIFGIEIEIDSDYDVVSDKTLTPSLEQKIFFDDLVLPIKDQIVELKSFYLNK